MECFKNGSCAPVQHDSMAKIADSLVQGTPLFTFILAIQITVSVIFVATIPLTRKDSGFWFLCILFAPFMVQTICSSYYTVMFYATISSYYHRPPILRTITHLCYQCLVVNFEYGLVIHTMNSIKIALTKKRVSGIAQRIPYLLLFVNSATFAVHLWRLPIIAYCLLIGSCALIPCCIILSIFIAIFAKDGPPSDNREIQHCKSRLFWIVPCLIAALIEPCVTWNILLNNGIYFHSFEDISVIMTSILPTFLMVCCCVFLPCLRIAILPCCYTPSNTESCDKVFLLPQNTSESTTGFDRASVSTVSNATLPSYASVMSNNSVSPMYQFVPVQAAYQNGQQQFFMPVPMQFYPPPNLQLQHPGIQQPSGMTVVQ